MDLLNIKRVDDWPPNRRKSSTTKKTSTGAFVTYQSAQTLASLGVRGDLWLTEQHVFRKNDAGEWVRWDERVQYPCPFEPHRVLGWTQAGYFKYLAASTFRKEAQKWAALRKYVLHIAAALLTTL